jgi:hypothetical protein
MIKKMRNMEKPKKEVGEHVLEGLRILGSPEMGNNDQEESETEDSEKPEEIRSWDNAIDLEDKEKEPKNKENNAEKPEVPVVEKKDLKYENKETAGTLRDVVESLKKLKIEGLAEIIKELEGKVDSIGKGSSEPSREESAGESSKDTDEEQLIAAEKRAEKAFSGIGKKEKSAKEKWNEAAAEVSKEHREDLDENLGDRKEFSSKNEIISITQKFLLKKLGLEPRWEGLFRNLTLLDKEGNVVYRLKRKGFLGLGGRFEVQDKDGKFIRELRGGFKAREIKTPEKGSPEHKRLYSDYGKRIGIESPLTSWLQEMLEDNIKEGIKNEVEKGTAEQAEESGKERQEEKQEALMSIELPKDPERTEKLRNKLEEYKGRDEKKDRTLKYKIAVLEKVLQDGNVNVQDLSRELSAKGGQFNEQAFESACYIIKNYCDAGGEGNLGGTGL